MPIWVVLPARILEGLFLVGCLGSFLVLARSGIEDIETLLGMDAEKKPS